MIAAALLCGLAGLQSEPRELAESVPGFHRDSLELLLRAEELYWSGECRRCLTRLEAMWALHPPGGEDWAASRNPQREVFLGTPPCYSALRMLTDCARWRLAEAEAEVAPPAPATAVLSVVLIGRARGLQPRDDAELARGAGVEVEALLDPKLAEDDHRVIHESLRLFREHLLAMTEGRLALEVRVVALPELVVPAQVALDGRRFAGLAPAAWPAIWAAVPAAVHARTDWWWLLYPSFVPEGSPDFAQAEFVTGGMATGPDGASPCFLIDDRWLLRKPPHLGAGPYTGEERRAYLPQWLQHEFFHHLFRSWPEFGLEAQSHGWFDRTSWPPDFTGRFEADYFHEALFRRLQTRADPPLHVGLRYAPPSPELYAGLRVDDLLGVYRHEPYENDWHEGSIERAGATAEGQPLLRWTNRAGVSWELQPDLAAGLLRCGPDNPYFRPEHPEASAGRILLERSEEGRWLPRIRGFSFQGASYVKQATASRDRKEEEVESTVLRRTPPGS